MKICIASEVMFSAVPRMTMNYATLNTSISAPYFHCSKTLNAANVTVGNTSMSTVRMEAISL